MRLTAGSRGFRVFIVVASSLTAISWAISLGAKHLGLGYPYNWPLYLPGSAGFDFFDYYAIFPEIHRPEFFFGPQYQFTYLAPGVFLYGLFYLPGLGAGFVLYLAIIVISIVSGLARLKRAFDQRNLDRRLSTALILLLPLTSFPLLFCLERGNLEVILAIGLALGTWAYCTGRTWIAALLWGVFGSVKLYPLILLAIFLSYRQYRQFVLALLAMAFTTLLALHYIGPNILTANSEIAHGVDAWLVLNSLQPRPGSFDHSLFGLLNLLLPSLHFGTLPMLRGYVAALAALATFTYFARARRLPFANQLLFLSVASVLLPPTSIDYTLLQLYAPLAVLLLAAAEGHQEYTVEIGILAAVLTPTNYLFLAGESRAGQIKAVLLLLLAALSLRRRPSDGRSDDAADSSLVHRRKKVRSGQLVANVDSLWEA